MVEKNNVLNRLKMTKNGISEISDKDIAWDEVLNLFNEVMYVLGFTFFSCETKERWQSTQWALREAPVGDNTIEDLALSRQKHGVETMPPKNQLFLFDVPILKSQHERTNLQ